MQKLKRITAFVISFLMLITMIPANAVMDAIEAENIVVRSANENEIDDNNYPGYDVVNGFSSNSFIFYIAEFGTMEEVTGAKIIVYDVEGKEYTAVTTSGFAQIEGIEDGRYYVTISKDGYDTLATDMELLRGECMTVQIAKAEDNVPVLYAECDGTNILAKLSKHMKNEGSLFVKIIANKNEKDIRSYRLVQNNRVIAESETEEFFVDAENIDENGIVYIELEYEDNSTSVPVRAFIKTYEADSKIFGRKSGYFRVVDGKVEFTYPNDGSILSGKKFTIDLGYTPFETQFNDDGTFKIAIGTKNLLSSDKLFDLLKISTITENLDTALNAYIAATEAGTVSLGWSAEPVLQVFGFGEGYVDDEGYVIWTGGKVVVRVGVEANGKWQFVAVAIPVTADITIGAYADVGVALKVDENDEIVINDEFALHAKFDGAIAAGIYYIANLGVYGTMDVEYKYVPKDKETTVTATGEFGARGVILGFQNRWPWWSGSKVIYKNNGTKHEQNTNASNLTDTDSYTMTERDYISAQSNWNGRPTRDLSGVNTLMENVYTDTFTDMVTVGGKQILVFLADNGTRTTGNHIALMYSVYENGVWSEPEYVYDDGTSDFYPSIASDGENVYVVWQNINGLFDENATLEQMYTASEIAIARFDVKNNKFVDTKNITNNNIADVKPLVYVEGKTAHIVWIRNESGEIFEGNDTVMYSQNGKSEQVYKTLDGKVISYTLGKISANKDKVTLAYSVDDGSGNVRSDYKFFNVGINGAFFFRENGTLQYTFDGENYYEVDTSDGIDIGSDYIVVTDMSKTYLVFTAREESGSTIYVKVYDDETNTWSGAIKVNDCDGYLDYLSAVCDNEGNIIFAFSKSDMIEQDNDFALRTDLCTMKFTSQGNIEIVGVSYDENYAVPGEIIPLTVYVRNNGTVKLDSFIITIDGEGLEPYSELINATIKPNEESEFVINYQLPEEFTGRTYFAYAFAYAQATNCLYGNCMSEKYEIYIESTDISMNVQKFVSSSNNIVTAIVSNNGVTPTSVILEAGIMDSENFIDVNIEIETEIIMPGEAVVVKLNDNAIANLCGGNDNAIYFNAYPGGNVYEYDYADNSGIAEGGDYAYVTYIDSVDNTEIACKATEIHHNALLVEVPVHEGYEFVCWDGDGIDVTEDITITAIYELGTYALSYFVDGELYNREYYQYGEEIVPISEPAFDGRIFSGWGEIPETMPGHDVDIFAVTGETFNDVTFVDGLDGTVIEVKSVEYGHDVELIQAPVHDGYDFVGWDKDGKNIITATTITALYEKSTPVETGIVGDADGNGVIEAADATVILRYVAGLIEYKHYTFTDADRNGIVEAADATKVLRHVAGLEKIG